MQMNGATWLVAVCVFFTASVGFAADENITITTYYPAPYGSYNELSVNTLRVGIAVPLAGSKKGKVRKASAVFSGVEKPAAEWGMGSEGEMVYSQDAHQFYFFDGSAWAPFGGSGWIKVPGHGTVINPTMSYSVMRWLPGKGISPTRACQQAGFKAFTGACRSMRGPVEIEGTLIASTHSGQWEWSCHYGEPYYYMDESSEVLCIP